MRPARHASRVLLLSAALLLAACGGGDAAPAAPILPGKGGVAVADPMLDALGLQVYRYPGAMATDPGPVIDQATYRQDLQRTAFIPGGRVADDYVLAWELAGLNPGRHTASKGSPAIVQTPRGPRIIVGADSGMVYSFAADGTLDWSAYTHAAAFGIHGTPTVADGVVYIGAYDGALYAYSRESGALLYRTEIGDSIGSSPLVHDGKVYVSVETNVPSGIMAILDAASGEILWRDDGLRDHPHSSVALDLARNVMVVGDNSGDLTAWSIEPPARRWVFKTDGAIKGPILLHDGAAFFGSWDQHLYAVDLESGALRWRVPTGARVMSGAALSPEHGLVYMGSHDHKLYALDVASGRIAWTFATGARILSSPTVAGGRVLFGSHDGYLYLLEAASGALVYKFKARGQVNASPALLGDRIVFTERGSDGAPGAMYVLHPRPKL